MRPVASLELAAWLSGTWSIRRAINDDVDAFTGSATFSPDGGAATNGPLLWHEAGRLRLGSYSGKAHRNLLLLPPERAAAWEVRFEDGRHFHYLDLSTGRCEVEHPCRADLYRGVYEVDGDDRLSVTWDVSGPRRHDRIFSEYRRAPGAAG
jgi:hypothetical protein